jgi:hypothetical protein
VYLVDAGKHPEIVSIASVSGGSLTNGFVAQQVELRGTSGDEFQRSVVRPLLKRLATAGTLLAPLLTWVYLATLVLGLVLVVLSGVLLNGLSAFGAVIAALVVWSFLAGCRGRVCARAFRGTLFRRPDGKPTLLRDVHKSTEHVLCATDLRSGGFVYFCGSFVYGYYVGVGAPGRLALADAVQASASLPGAFPPRWLRSARFGFHNAPGDPPRVRTRSLVLVDGGVYDNMADQWARGYQNRAHNCPEVVVQANVPEELVVVNASAGMRWTPYRRGRWPLVGELFALLRDKSILYNATTAPRRRDLVDLFEYANETGHGLRGALVNITQSPYRVAHAFEDEVTPRGDRARTVIAALRTAEVAAGPAASEAGWVETARLDSAVPTVLWNLGNEVAARLAWHAYVLAMCNLHVLLDYPLRTVPSLSTFRDLCK